MIKLFLWCINTRNKDPTGIKTLSSLSFMAWSKCSGVTFFHWCSTNHKAQAKSDTARAAAFIGFHELEATSIPGTCQHPDLWSQGTVFHWHQHTESHSGEDKTSSSSSSAKTTTIAHTVWVKCCRTLTCAPLAQARLSSTMKTDSEEMTASEVV